MDFEIDKGIQGAIEMVRQRGRTEMRPIGLEADRLGRPIPVDDPYFARVIERGEGRTRWRRPSGKEKKKEKKGGPRRSRVTVMSLLMVEELAYWDRGVMVANPGVGLPEASEIGRASCRERV